MSARRVRPYAPADEAAVRAIFRATVALGKPLPFPLGHMPAYERLCMDWFLGPGAADAGVLDDGGRVLGYVLVCTDLVALRRWSVRVGAGWVLTTIGRLLTRRLHGQEARFHLLRLRDGWDAFRSAPPAPMPAYVHLNLDPGAHAGLGALLLARHADGRCRQAGLPGWYAEMNARPGRRATALAAGGIVTVHRQPNATLSWLAGKPVERLTIVRALDRATPLADMGTAAPARPSFRRAREPVRPAPEPSRPVDNSLAPLTAPGHPPPHPGRGARTGTGSRAAPVQAVR